MSWKAASPREEDKTTFRMRIYFGLLFFLKREFVAERVAQV